MLRDSNLLLIAASVFSLVFLYFINVSFMVYNQNLRSSVNLYMEKKSVLRAQYLSKISANNLAHRADNFDMVLPSSNIFTVKKKEAKKVSRRYKKSFLQRADEALRSSGYVVGGY